MVELTYPGHQAITLQARDVSDGGVFLERGDHPLPPMGAEVYLHVMGELDGEDPPTVKAKVVRVMDQGIGLYFME